MKHAQHGLGLIEVLLAASLVGVAFGVIAQQFGLNLKNHIDHHAYRIAIRLAEQKLEDLHDFSQLQTSADFDFTDIDDNQGGKLTNGQLMLPAGKVDAIWTQGSSVDFYLSWQVEHGYWLNQQLSYAKNVATDRQPDQKRITVTINWNMAQQPQHISRSSIVAAFSPLATRLLERPQANIRQIRVQHRDHGEIDNLPLAVADNQQQVTESTWLDNGKTHHLLTDTIDLQGGLLQRREFMTVSCQCRFNGADWNKTAAYSRWNAANHSLEAISGDKVYKTQGCERDELTGLCSQQNSVCQRCCQTHHDPDSRSTDNNHQPYCDPTQGILERCYDPFRDSVDYDHGQHRHYDAQGQVVNSGAYEESCRLRSINGNWEVYQDWHRLDLKLLPANWLQSHNLDYQNYIRQILTTLINQLNSPFFGQVHPDSASFFPWPDSSQQLNFAQPWPLKIGESQRLSARGLYLDFMSFDAIKGLRAQLQQQPNQLSGIPFYAFELNTLAPWCQTDSLGGWCTENSGQVHVGAGDPDTPNGLNPGVVAAINPAQTTTSVRFSLRRSNSGLTATPWPSDHFQGNNSDHLIDSTQFDLNTSQN